jgi:DNA-binding MarR family transcriptional regulator
LETAALLEIQQDAKNRRLRRVRLTETGRGKLRQAVLAWHAAQAAAMAAIPEGLVHALLEGSDRLAPRA